MVEFRVPPRYCPLPPSTPHPAQETLEKQALGWLAAQHLFTQPGVRERAADTKSHILIAQITPDAPIDRTQPGVDWAYLMFLFDDLRTDLGPTATNTADLMNWLYDWVEVLSRPDSPPPATAGRDPLMLAFAALSRRVRACTTQELWRRWVDTHRLFCWGALWESAQRTTRTATSFDAFLSARAYLAGSPLPLLAGEIAHDLRVPEAERNHPLVRAAVEAAWMMVGLDDDIYSLPKEGLEAAEAGRDPDAEPSAVPIIKRELRCDTATAVNQLVDYRDRIMLLLIRLRERANQCRLSGDTLAYLDLALCEVRVDAIDWPPLAPRYTAPVGKSEEPIHLIWSATTDRPPSDGTALPFPAISWWWDHIH
uniref:Terpene synthase family protein n=1 Tax=Streptomyces sp. NBC_00049 TaxID=2903617 RepID=A0AAU2K048_9ACTN